MFQKSLNTRKDKIDKCFLSIFSTKNERQLNIRIKITLYLINIINYNELMGGIIMVKTGITI